MERQLGVHGVVCAVVGFTSSFAIVLAGLRAVGASPAQAASGVLVMSVLMGLGGIVFARRFRQPITFAWSTGGGALLISVGPTVGGWPAAVGAFLCCGLMITAVGLSLRLADWISAIPASIAQAMLAGVLLPICLRPVLAVAELPWLVLPIFGAWLAVLAWKPLAAVPAGFSVAMIIIGFSIAGSAAAFDPIALLPRLELTPPVLEPAAVITLALPLFVVTMATQGVPGAALMSSFGYRIPWRRSMLWSGLSTMLAAPAGGHALSLAALSAALVASPAVHPDPDRRWPAAIWAGGTHVLLGLLSSALAVVVTLAPPEIMQTVAALALLGTLGSALQTATAEAGDRIPVVLTILVAASGVSVAFVGGAFWALLLGIGDGQCCDGGAVTTATG